MKITSSTGLEINSAFTVGGASGKAAGKETIWIPASAMQPTTSNGCSALTTNEISANMPEMVVLDFDQTSAEYAQFSICFPKSWDEGTVSFQFFWSGIAATTGVTMQLQGVAVDDNQNINGNGFGTAVSVNDNALGGTSKMAISAESGAMTIADTPLENDICYFRLGRNPSDGNDTMAGDLRLHGIKLFFTTNAANDA